MSDAHYMIEKTVKKNVTSTAIYELNEQQSVEELARLLGGSTITEAVLANAKEMRQLALEYKK
jgi:DNA repair protein RecN (Recombination protein N)